MTDVMNDVGTAASAVRGPQARSTTLSHTKT